MRHASFVSVMVLLSGAAVIVVVVSVVVQFLEQGNDKSFDAVSNHTTTTQFLRHPASIHG